MYENCKIQVLITGEIIDVLDIEKINEKLEECPVCFTSSETTIKIKRCNHVFCEDCIQKWLKNHKNTCPICRINVIIEQENINNESQSQS